MNLVSVRAAAYRRAVYHAPTGAVEREKVTGGCCPDRNPGRGSPNYRKLHVPGKFRTNMQKSGLIFETLSASLMKFKGSDIFLHGKCETLRSVHHRGRCPPRWDRFHFCKFPCTVPPVPPASRVKRSILIGLEGLRAGVECTNPHQPLISENEHVNMRGFLDSENEGRERNPRLVPGP